MKLLTVEDVQQLIYDIRVKSDEGDSEAAHSLEDELYTLVLEEIAKGNPDAIKLAQEALESQYINFSRWYA